MNRELEPSECSPSSHSPGALRASLTPVCVARAHASVERGEMETDRLRRPWGPRARKGTRPLSSLSRQPPVFRMEWSPVPGRGATPRSGEDSPPLCPAFLQLPTAAGGLTLVLLERWQTFPDAVRDSSQTAAGTRAPSSNIPPELCPPTARPRHAASLLGWDAPPGTPAAPCPAPPPCPARTPRWSCVDPCRWHSLMAKGCPHQRLAVSGL